MVSSSALFVPLPSFVLTNEVYQCIPLINIIAPRQPNHLLPPFLSTLLAKHLLAWASTHLWLSDLNPRPMPFRKSLFGALSTAHKTQVLDVYILLLSAFQTATLHSPPNDALVPKDLSFEPFVKLLILFEGVVLAPLTDAKPSQYKHLVSQ